MAAGLHNFTASGEWTPGGTWSGDVKIAMTACMVLALFLVGISIGRAAEREKDETVVTVQVSSADHEVQEGYFALGEQATVMVKPGSALYQFLSRQRGRKVKIVLTEAATTELSTIAR
jgi:hypothetical protein